MVNYGDINISNIIYIYTLYIYIYIYIYILALEIHPLSLCTLSMLAAFLFFSKAAASPAPPTQPAQPPGSAWMLRWFHMASQNPYRLMIRLEI